MIDFILTGLIIFSVWFIYVFSKDFWKHRKEMENGSWVKTGIIGFLVNFFDALGMALPAIIAVLIAALIVKSLPLDSLRWIVMAVIIYTSISMLYRSITDRKENISTAA